ncbi:MAG: hypothetical protein GTO14_23515 [Anaerolineales bacterium]|nr:hypothetical protein [Anaerolineales bacterium]
MVENRGLIIAGAVILLFMLIVGSFSLGAYFGQHGLSQDGLRLQPAQPGQPQQGAPALRPQGFPAGEPDVIGLIRAGMSNGIALATKDGPRLIEIEQSTKVVDVKGIPLKLHDLRPGDIIAAFGEFATNDNQRLQATYIVRLPQRSPDQP